ncbi:MAG: hypothetical protein NT031_00795, partial [Planctomycetota bacterium]|nr:hypothetical protein [Planctomycetota bacterium]
MRIASCLLAVAASAEVLCGGPPAASRPAGPEAHEYDAVLFDGNKTGYTALTRRQSDTEVVTVSVMHLTLRRGPVPLNVDATTTCRETLDSKPLALSYVQKMGPLTSKVDGTIVDGKFIYTSSSSVGGQAKPKTIPWPDGALLSEGLEQLSRAKGFAPGTR